MLSSAVTTGVSLSTIPGLSSLMFLVLNKHKRVSLILGYRAMIVLERVCYYSSTVLVKLV